MLQRRFDAGEWSGTEALEYVRETRAVRKRLTEEFGMTELDIEIALHDLRAETP